MRLTDFVWCAGLIACATAQAADLPRRNLLVEVRQTEDGQMQTDDVGVKRGDVVINSNGQVTTRAAGGWQVSTQTRRGGSVQQLWVLNGSRATLRLMQAVPLQWWQVVSAPVGVGAGQSGNARAVPTTVWTEAGRSVQVQPTWRGGRSDVTVEVFAEQSQFQDPNQAVGEGGVVARMNAARAEMAAQNGNGGYGGQGATPGATQTSSVLTTVQVPLGTWVTIASTADDERTRDRGVLSSRDAQRSRQRLVQIRVTVPGAPD